MKSRTVAGFTLLELLAAAAITVLLVGLVLAVTTGALELWRKGQADFVVLSDAGIALDLLERDLQCATSTTVDATWLAITLVKDGQDLRNRGWLRDGVRYKPGGEGSFRPLPGSGSADGSALGEARFGLAGAWLRVITATAESGSEPALPRAVAWQIARRPLTGVVSPANPAPRRYLLFRSALAAGETFAHGGDLAAPAFTSSSEAPSGTRAPSTMMNPAVADAVIANVVDFGVWLYARGADGALRRTFPTTDDGGEFRTNPATAAPPAVADVFVRVLTEEGARQIELIETGRLVRPREHSSDEAWWWSVADTHSRVFTRRIELKGGSP